MADSIIRIPPPPATVVEMYLAAILDEMRTIHALLAPAQEIDKAADAVELKEQRPPTNKSKRLRRS